jgi:nucleotide-binding universal stress UspA family protein
MTDTPMPATATASIVVGVDGSDHAAHALRWARREADLHDARLTAVLVWDLFNQRHPSGERAFDPDYDDAAADRALLGAIEAALDPQAARAVQRKVVGDLPAAGLLTAADGADLLVVGARGLGGFRGLLLGSVSQQCLHHATAPVAIVRSADPDTSPDTAPDTAPDATTGVAAAQPGGPDARDVGDERLVVGVDGSASARSALRWALAEGALRRATVEVVHAWDPPVTGGLAGLRLLPRLFKRRAENDARRLVDDMVREALAAGGTKDVSVARTVTAGAAARHLLEAAATADLLVVGRRGAGGFSRLLLGSVSESIAHHAPCPVVVMPPDRAD